MAKGDLPQGPAGTPAPAWIRSHRRQLAAAVVALGVVVVALVASSVLTGLQVNVGPGVSAEQAAAVKRDFDSARDAMNQALANNDATRAQGKVTGNALQDLERQIQANQAQGQRVRRQVSPSSTEVLQEADPNDPTVLLEVHQTGSIHQDFFGQSGLAVLSSSDLTFDSRYWIRADGGAYAITDAQVSEQPLPASFPWWSVASLLGVALAVAVTLVLRKREGLGLFGAPTLDSALAVDAAKAVPAEATPSAPSHQGKVSARPRQPDLVIQTIGRIRVTAGGQDLTPVVLGRPVSGFLWLWLLVMAIAKPGGQLLRADVCEEAFAGIDRKSQQGRLRGHLYELKSYPAMWNRLQVDRTVLSFDLTDCEVDAVEVLRLSQELRASGSLDPTRVSHVLELLAATSGEFMPGWGSIVAGVTRVEGTATETVSELGQRLQVARADILLILGDFYLARHEAEPAVAALEESLMLREERHDIADKLVVALRAARRDGEAARLLDRYGPGS